MAVNEPAATFGDLLRDYRRAAGLTQEELAERAGVSPRSISEMERGGAHVPRRDTVSLLVRALALSGSDRTSFESMVERTRRPRPRLEATGPRLHALPTELRFERPTHNLPRTLTSFIGREDELHELRRVLPNAPLLTLVGAGGVGKTRLAQELVREQIDNYADGCWLIELASLCDPGLVVCSVTEAVGLHEIHARDILHTLTEYLRTKQMLLVLDNCEHLIEACAELAAHLLRSCPNLQIIATSREPLSIPGEVTWRVPPLALPDLQRQQSADEMARSPAVRLFIERARSVNHNLLLTDANVPAIARICIGVDGIPLALELAAARARVLTVEQLAERLEHDSAVLGGATRTALPQHQTIRSTIDWSYYLLGDDERALLRRLSVFSGGWTLRLAEDVCSGDAIARGDVLDLLTQLVDKSMAIVDATHSEARYRLLEPIRHYALEQLEGSGEAAMYQSRHSAVVLELARELERDPGGPAAVAILDRLEIEHDNVRAALRWALDHQQASVALRASAALFHFWHRRGHFQEGCAWLEMVLAAEHGDPDHARGRALNGLASLYWRGSHLERAEEVAQEALAINRAAGTMQDVAWALINLGMIAYYHEDVELAIARLREAVQASRDAGTVPLLSLALTFLARALLWSRGPHDAEAVAALREALPLADTAESRTATSYALVAMGDAAWRQGRPDEAIPLWRRALLVRSEQVDRRGVAGAIERTAWGLAATEQYTAAAWFFGASDAQHRALGIELRHDEAVEHERLLTATRTQLGPLFNEAWSAGRSANADEAVTFGLDTTAR